MGEIHNLITSVKSREGFKFDGEVAKLIGIDPRELATHKSRDNLPAKLQQWYCDYYNIERKKFKTEIKLTNTDIQLKEASDMDAQYVIDLQKDKIETQAIEIKTLKDALQKKQAESTHWESLEYDFICDVSLFRKGFRFGRIINSVTDLNKQAQVLGYTADQMKSFWDIGAKHMKMSEHPIEKIINEETQRDVKKQMSTLPILFDAMKATVGDHYIPQPIIYIHKQGHNVGAISYNKVEWSSMKVTAKVKFLVD